MYSTSPDSVIRDAMELHFAIITGLSEPVKKAKAPNKHPEKEIPFTELSFLNIMAFRNAFLEASKRGLCSPAEIMAGNEILAITG